MAYNGKRVYRGLQISSHKRRGGSGNTLARVLFFPAAFLYWELVLHIYMGAPLKYVPIYLVFGAAAGLVCSALTLPFRRQANYVLTRVLTVLLCLVYVVEMICKKILQTYYPLSALGTAAGNKLTDYMDVIVSTVIASIPVILILFLPAILIFALGERLLGSDRFDIRFSGLILAGALILHLLGLGVVHLPWSGDLTPKQLYRMDSNINDQVEQLGLVNMLRLDVKHVFFPPDHDLDADFAGLGTLGGGGSASSAGPDSSAAGSSSSSEVPPEDPGPVIDTSPNVMEVDLAKIAEEASDEDVQWLASYFNSVAPTKKNEYTGMFEGYNVIFFTLEGFSGYAIDPELTPTLYKLKNEGFVFNNFYTALHFTSTSGGEFQNLTGLYPKNGMPITMVETGERGTNLYFSLAQQLGREGYQVLGYHGNGDMYDRLRSHTNLGYSWNQFGHGADDLFEVNSNGKLLWPQRDSFMVEKSVDDYANSDQPFHVYYLTISGHMPYSDNRVVAPYRETVRALPYSETTQNYVATAMEVDKALETLLQKLEEAGKLENTLIVAAPDHIPYFDVASLEELTGKELGDSKDIEYLKENNIDFDLYKSSLILWSASMEEPVQVDKVTCQVDILPTLSNLLGLEYDSRMLSGSDALSDSDGLVVFTSNCWKSDKGFYDRFTGEFTPAEGVSMTETEIEEYVSAMKKLVNYKRQCTELIVETDFYDYVFGDQ